MKSSRRLVTTFLFLSLLFCQNGSLIAESRNELPGLEWERRLGDDNFKHTAQAIAISEKDRSIWVAGTSSLAGGSDEGGKFWVWKLNQEGEKILEIRIESPSDDRKLNPAYPYIKSLAVMETGELFMVSEFTEFKSSFLKIGEDGSLLFRKMIAKPGGDTIISKIVPTTDNNFLLIGHKSAPGGGESRDAHEDALVVKVDAEGNILWEKIFDLGKNGSFVEGYPTEEGGAILIGNIGAYCRFCIGPSEIWVVRLDVEGNIQSEQISSGRNGSLAKGQGVGYVVLYDKNDLTSKDQLMFTQEVWMQAFNLDLKPLWQTQLFNVKGNFGRFNIVSVPSGGFVIVGSKNNQFWASKINMEGGEIWNFFDAGEIERMSANYRTVSMNDQFFILYAAYSKNEERRLNTKVGIIKFIPK